MKNIFYISIGVIIGILVIILLLYIFGFSILNQQSCELLGGTPYHGPSSCSTFGNGFDMCTKDMVYQGCSFDVKPFDSIFR